MVPILRILGYSYRETALIDAHEVLLSLTVSGANTHDVQLLADTLDAVISERPAPRKWKPRHLCADAGYKGEAARKAAPTRNDRLHIKQRKEESWGMKRTHSRFNRFRQMLIRFDKTESRRHALLFDCRAHLPETNFIGQMRER